MKIINSLINIFLVLLLVFGESFLFFYSTGVTLAAFDVKGVQLFKDNTICFTMAGSTTSEGLTLSTLTTNFDSVQAKISSSGSLCPIPPFFTGGALRTTAGMDTQAQPVVQGLGRGILISETAGTDGGVSSSGDPAGFNSLIGRVGTLGSLATTIFEISLPSACDVIDDDNDIDGASSDLSTVNDFTLPTCTSTNPFTLQCNSAVDLLTAINGIVPASGSTPAKIRFVISARDGTGDLNMIDSILIRLDSQDIFCPSNTTGPLTATVIAKNAADSPTMTETLGTADLGTPTTVAKLSYVTETATSQKGETSTNQIGSTPILVGSSTTASKLEIEELHNESIPLAGQSSAILINPSSSSTVENNTINLWVVPTRIDLFSSAPASSDITFSDNSLILNSAPYIVMTTSDDLNAPFGTLVIPVKKNAGATDPSTVKTKITIANLGLNPPSSSTEQSTISLAFFEPLSGAIVNTPAALSTNNTENTTNSLNFSAFAIGSTRALAQNSFIGGSVNEATAATQAITDSGLSLLTTRNATLGAPQITGFTRAVSSVTEIDISKVSAIAESNSVITITGDILSSIGGAKLTIDSLSKGAMSAFDSVTITSKSDGSFSAKLKADFSSGDVTLNFNQSVSGQNSTQTSKVISQSSSPTSDELTCDKTVCGCENLNCTPTITLVLSYIETNGGLSSIVSAGGNIFTELINSLKKALGLS